MKRSITGAEFRALQAKRKTGRSLYRRSSREARTVDGIVFDSKAEAARYCELRDLKRSGRVAWFLRQPLFDLAGVKYHADFIIRFTDSEVRFADGQVHFEAGRVRFEDVKGKFRGPFRERALRNFRRNAEQVKQLYGITVELVER